MKRKVLFLLIDTDIVDFVAHGKGIVLRFASVDSTDGKVEKDILGLVERIGMVADGTVDGVEGGNVVEQFAIKIDTDGFGIPIHCPDVEFLCPVGVFLEEMGERDALGVPNGIVRTVVAPCSIGENVRLTTDLVVFHDVDFAIGRPRHAVTQCPNGRPSTTHGRDASTHLQTAIKETVSATGVHTGRRITSVWTIALPTATACLITRIRNGIEFAFEDEDSILAIGVLLLIPLIFFITHKSTLGMPDVGVEGTCAIEFIVPNELPVLGISSCRK